MLRHQLNFWSNPWRPAQDWFTLAPALDVWDEPEQKRTFLPACEVEEKADHFLITLDVPGVTKDDIRIETANGKLIVSAERKQDITETKDSRYFSERHYGKFERIFELGEHVNAEKIEAAYENGVLRIALGKADEVKPRRIEVRSGEKGSLLNRADEKKETKPLN
jgi:HSP20 family protein